MISATTDLRRHAVVVGGSMAGLLAARVLADRFERVTVVERDRFPDGFENRKGVPQASHAHALLPRGFMIMARLFPGLAEELVSDGAIASDIPAESRRYQRGGYRVRFNIGRKSLLMSRPFLEGHIRRRVRELPNVTLLEERAVTGLLSDRAEGRVRGVTVKRRGGGAAEQRLDADLVVDASGRGSRAAAWLEEMGYERPSEERIEIGVGYTTRVYRSRPDDLSGTKLVIIEPTPGRERCIGAMFRMEDERWIVTLGGWLGERAPADEAGFVEFARNLPAPDIYEVIKDAEPLGEAAKYNFPANLRRRYERLSASPQATSSPATRCAASTRSTVRACRSPRSRPRPSKDVCLKASKTSRAAFTGASRRSWTRPGSSRPVRTSPIRASPETGLSVPELPTGTSTMCKRRPRATRRCVVPSFS